MSKSEVRFDESRSRWELFLEGADTPVSWLDVQIQTIDGMSSYLGYHTETKVEERRKGYASALMKGILEQMLSKRDTVRFVPLCPFAVLYMKQHPEFDMVLPDGWEKDIQLLRKLEATTRAMQIQKSHHLH